MPRGYTKEFLVDAALFHFLPLGEKAQEELRPMYEDCYDKVGKDEFRARTCLDPEAIRRYVRYQKTGVLPAV